METLKAEHFKIENNSISSRMTISDREKPLIYIDFSTKETPQESLKQNIKTINEQLLWIEENAGSIKSRIIAEGYISTAEQWVKDLSEKDGELYIVGKEKVSLPISEDDFRNSMLFSEIAIHFTPDQGIVSEVYIRCKPNYFYSHALLVYVYNNKSIKVVGLAG